MPTTYKVLGQSNPAATTDTTLYTVPAATTTILSTITVCNLAATPATFRIAVRPAGAVITAAHYVAYDAALSQSDTLTLTLGITLATTDVLTVRASTVNVSFNVFGAELS
jgi:hypothetical protein